MTQQKSKKSEEEELVRQLVMIERELEARETYGHPGVYNLPDLLFPQGYEMGRPLRDVSDKEILARDDFLIRDGWVREPLDHPESDEEYEQRRDKVLADFIEERLFIIKDAEKIPVRTIDKSMAFIADLFFRRTRRAILWKPRGGGGSLAAAVIIFLSLIYHKKSIIDIAGSQKQATMVYNYVTGFWNCFPGLREGLLAKDPLKHLTPLKTGIDLRCILPGTEIFTDSGLKSIEDVCVHDKVLTEDGTFHPVLATIPTHRDEECLEFVVYGGLPFRTTKDHPVLAHRLTDDEKRRKRAGGWKVLDPSEFDLEWIAAEELTVGDLVFSPNVAFSECDLDYSCDRYSDGRGSFSFDFSAAFYRFLGYWLSDGSCGRKHVSITFHAEQDQYVSDVCALVDTLFGASPCVLERDNKKIVHFCCAPLARLLKLLGKSDGKRVPVEWLLAADTEKLENLLCGLFRGDGCAVNCSLPLTDPRAVKREMSYTTISPSIAQWVLLVANKLGMCPSMKKYQREPSEFDGVFYERKPIYQIRFTGACCERACEIAGFPVLDLDRPTRLTHLTTDAGVFTPIKSISEIEHCGMVYDLTVDTNHSFVGTYATFHNCIPATDKQVRGEHTGQLYIDEACLLPGTPVITDRGIIPVECVQEGDRVINQQGAWTRVRHVWSKHYDGRVRQIIPLGWSAGWEVTDDHRILSARGEKNAGRRSLSDTFSWIESGDLRSTDWLFVPKPKCSGECSTPVSMTPEFARWLGYWIGDGWTDKGRSRNVLVVFNSAQQQFIEDYAHLSRSLFSRSPSETYSDAENRKNTTTIQFTHKELAEWLDRNCGVNALEKGVPVSLISSMSDVCVHQFIVGFSRADGSLWCGKASSGGRCRRLTLNTSSDRLSAILVYALARLGIVPSFRKRPSKISKIRGKEYLSKERWCIDLSGEAMEDLAVDISPEWERKASRNRFRPVSGGTAVQVKSIEDREYSGQVWDIEVEEGESFLLPNGLVHNCQQDPHTEKAMEAALQTVLSEADPVIVLLSTFHLPSGLFQDYWDNAEEKGFKRYTWNCFDTMKKCTRGMEKATADDPKALEYCKECPLTYSRRVISASGEDEYITAGCNGTAREATGWASFESILSARKMNRGSKVFEIEFACERPNYEDNVYDPEMIDFSLCNGYEIEPERQQLACGIDWGLETENSLCMTLAALRQEHVYVHQCIFMDHRLVSDVSEILAAWMSRWGMFPILADASHPFNNRELANAGYDVRPVSFGTWKKTGIQNLSKYFVYKRIQINQHQTNLLVEQLKKYRMKKTGKIVKKDDHGPDSLMCVMLQWRFEDTFGDDIQRVSLSITESSESEQPQVTGPQFPMHGIAPVVSPPQQQEEIVHPAYQSKVQPPPEYRSPDKNVLMF